MDIKGKIIIVTGASQGIGEATAKLLAQNGAKVILAARSIEKLKELAEGLPDSVAMDVDMRKPDDIQKMIDETVKKFGRIDILINNAGRGLYGPVEKIDIEDYKNVMELNVYGVLRAMQRAIPVMRRQGGGMILNISSRVSKNYFPYLAAYASTKYALNALSLTARTELADDHIVVSVFHPKMTRTNFGKNAIGVSPMARNRDTGPFTNPGPGGRPAPDVDTPEQVAEQILEQIKSEEPERAM